MFFTLAQAPTLLTRAGVPITSVVLEPTVIEVPQEKLTDIEHLVHDVVKANDGATEDTIIDAAVAEMPAPNGRDMRRTTVRRTLTALVQKGVVSINNGQVRIVDVFTDFTDLLGVPSDE